ncbi:MAG: cation transporter [Dermatophilaceae bacterium]
MRTIGLVVGGMDCRRCVREVSARLRDVPGVETVMADTGSSVVRLAGTMTVGDVLGALRGLTYPVELLGESGDAAGI